MRVYPGNVKNTNLSSTSVHMPKFSRKLSIIFVGTVFEVHKFKVLEKMATVEDAGWTHIVRCLGVGSAGERIIRRCKTEGIRLLHQPEPQPAAFDHLCDVLREEVHQPCECLPATGTCALPTHVCGLLRRRRRNLAKTTGRFCV